MSYCIEWIHIEDLWNIYNYNDGNGGNCIKKTSNNVFYLRRWLFYATIFSGMPFQRAVLNLHDEKRPISCSIMSSPQLERIKRRARENKATNLSKFPVYSCLSVAVIANIFRCVSAMVATVGKWGDPFASSELNADSALRHIDIL